MRHVLLLAVATTAMARAFMSDVCETVLIVGNGKDGIRVNKAEFDADQASDKPKMKAHKDDAEQSVAGNLAPLPLPEGVTPKAAPAAPDFSGGDNVTPLIMDPDKQAAVPTSPSPNQYLVMTEGKGAKAKSFVVDGTGAKVADKDGINSAGYATEKEAWDAILALPH